MEAFSSKPRSVRAETSGPSRARRSPTRPRSPRRMPAPAEGPSAAVGEAGSRQRLVEDPGRRWRRAGSVRRGQLGPARAAVVPFVQTAPSRCCREIRPRLKPARRGRIPRQDLGPSLLIAGEGLAAWREMKRLPIREKAGELVLRHARPGPYVAGVHMNELGRGVVTDAAIRMRSRSRAGGRSRRPAAECPWLYPACAGCARKHCSSDVAACRWWLASGRPRRC